LSRLGIRSRGLFGLDEKDYIYGSRSIDIRDSIRSIASISSDVDVDNYRNKLSATVVFQSFPFLDWTQLWLVTFFSSPPHCATAEFLLQTDQSQTTWLQLPLLLQPKLLRPIVVYLRADYSPADLTAAILPDAVVERKHLDRQSISRLVPTTPTTSQSPVSAWYLGVERQPPLLLPPLLQERDQKVTVS
jgi:hypothetical protein